MNALRLIYAKILALACKIDPKFKSEHFFVTKICVKHYREDSHTLELLKKYLKPTIDKIST